jgi:PAS domain S-box-containing protein
MRFKGGIREKVALKEKQEEIFSQKGYVESIISSMTDALIVVNPDSTIRLVNKATLDVLGYKENELIGKPVKNIFLQEEEILRQYFQEIIEQGAAYNIGLTFLTKQGKAIPVNFSGAVMREGEKITGIVGVVRDMRQITAIISDLEKKKRDLEERSKDSTRMQRAMLHIMEDLQGTKDELKRANKELQKSDQLKSDFVSMVSHELRTPLTVTREAISQVLDGVVGEISQAQKEFLSMSIEGIDRLARLIKDLLDISKMEAHKIGVKRELVDVVSLAKAVSSDFGPAFQSKGLEIRYSFPMDKVEVYEDKDSITQIFVNLISNALKFTQAGYIEISVVDKRDVVEYAVSDTGIGISEEDLPKVFGKFEQFSQEAGSGEGGTGLGLSISKGIVELHHGKIWVESKIGQGTKFTFVFPKYTGKKMVEETLEKAIQYGQPLSVLIFNIKKLDTACGKDIDKGEIDLIINNLEKIIRGNFHRKEDSVIKEGHAILTMLPDTNKYNAILVLRRTYNIAQDYLEREKLREKIDIYHDAIVYPDDGENDKELYSRIESALNGSDSKIS